MAKVIKQTQSPAAPPALKAYVARQPVKIGGKRAAPGDVVEIDDETAAELLALGAIDAAIEAAPEPAEPDKQPEG